jgi:hypothetical protein
MPRDSRLGKRVARPGAVAASTRNQALSAPLFLDKVVLGRPLTWLDDQVVRARMSERLPTVFSREETRAILAQLDGIARLAIPLPVGPPGDGPAHD